VSTQTYWRPTLPETEFDAFIFDCDGTLADTMPTHYRAWCMALGDHAHLFPEPFFYSLGGVPTARIIEILNEKHDLTLDIDALVEHKEALFESLSDLVEPIQGIVDIARSHFGRKPMAVASGGHRHIVTRTLRAIGVHELFEAVVCSEDYTRGKPFPDPFLEAARRLKVPPERCLVFEDTETGRTAAHAAGMGCVLVPRDL
jgi:beta-phosphoglucomutase-like phosphatase (HAD superfamily)